MERLSVSEQNKLDKQAIQHRKGRRLEPYQVQSAMAKQSYQSIKRRDNRMKF